MDKADIKKVLLKNNYVLGFSIASLVIFIVLLMKLLNLSLGISFISTLIGLFPFYLWIFLLISLVLGAVAAYYEKYMLMFLPVMIWLLATTAVIRTSNISQLKDVTTNDWTLGPDLDPFLYLRHAKEIVNGTLENPDLMRQAPLGVNNYALTNIMPWAILAVHKAINIFGSFSVTYAAIISPVIFFLISLVGFFIFCALMFSFKFSKGKSLFGATVASFLYAAIPQMLHRTVAGIPEIESLGMVWFWLSFLFFGLAWKNKQKKYMILFGILAGVFTGAMSWTWGGYRYIYMALALTGLLMFLFNPKDKKNLIIFASWTIPAIILEFLRIGSVKTILFSLSDTGLSLFVLFVLIVSWILLNNKIEEKLRLHKINLPHSIKALIISIVAAVLAISIFKPDFIFTLYSQLIERLLYPFGRARIGLTVAENKAPYFVEVFQNFGYLVWIFILGMIMLFYSATKNFKLKEKIILNTFFILFVITFIFSRVSPTHLLNGENFFSKLLYLGGLILFLVVVLYLMIKNYKKEDSGVLEEFSKISFSYMLLLAFSFLAIVSMRGAIRLFFIISPLLIIISVYLPLVLWDFKNKDSKHLGKILAIIVLIVLALVFVQYQQATIGSTAAEVPSSYTVQWQQAMAWARNFTPESSIFVHWWDYGYWVQSIGERATVTDGGHANGWWDHTTARYLLTTPRPETALSLMKTHNVSYLLIDSTDVGKYSAFSTIGSDTAGADRAAFIPTLLSDPSQVQEKANSTLRLYQGGYYIDEDIVYQTDQGTVYLPQGKAVLAAVIVETAKYGDKFTLMQPTAVFVLNGKRVDLPVQEMYFQGELIKFGKGINVTLRVVPTLIQTSSSVEVDKQGAIMYLSGKTRNSLFAQLYLMNDPNNIYPTLKLANSEDEYIVQKIRDQVPDIGEFVFYGELRGPIKIWSVSYPDDILVRPEFLNKDGEYASLDSLEFKK